MTDKVSNSIQEHGWQVPTFDTLWWNGKKNRWCVVIPVINEGERIRNLLSQMHVLNIHQQADVIIVDGGTTDGSLDKDFLNSKNVSGLLLKTGAGKLSAQLRCAYAFALAHEYDGIVTIDGNDKDDPVSIPSFIQALASGVDFVQASRYIAQGVAENTPKIRDLAIRLLHAPLLSFFSGFHWTDTTQGFRAYSRGLLMDEKIAIFRTVFMTYELLAYLSYRAPRLKYRCIELGTTRRYPKDGKIPTKISSFRGNWDVFRILIWACLGFYNP